LDRKSKVKGRWSSREGIALSGSSGELRELAGLLEDATEGLTIALAELNDEMIKPYEGAISHIIVHIEQGAKLRIARIGGVMELRGDAGNLAALGECMPDDESLPPFYHVHVEFYPGHFFLAAESEALVIVSVKI